MHTVNRRFCRYRGRRSLRTRSSRSAGGMGTGIRRSISSWTGKYPGLGLNELRARRELRNESTKLKRWGRTWVSTGDIVATNGKASCAARGAANLIRTGTLRHERHWASHEALRIRLRQLALAGGRVR